MSESGREEATVWFAGLRDRLCAAFEAIEGEASGERPPGRFERTPWERQGQPGEAEGGGGTMAMMRGRVFEKVGVNVSAVHGVFSEEFRKQVPGAAADGRFWAGGISLVAHPLSPHVPTAHMNTRYIATSEAWFGGGADLTPMAPGEGGAGEFHAALKSACDAHDLAYYPRFKAWCDEYFYLRHRGEPRGAGGIFFDNLNSGGFARDLAFVKDVGLAFLDVYARLVRRRMTEPWTEEERRQQLVKRGRYVEFNLLYDRGTLFGLKTGGNIEAILMSLPPVVMWP